VSRQRPDPSANLEFYKYDAFYSGADRSLPPGLFEDSNSLGRTQRC
jgi:hypothetical protein